MVELGTDFVTRDVMYRGGWEPEETSLLRALTPANGVFIDVGANVGYFSLLASRWVGPMGRVYALEPVRGTYRRLIRNLELNQASNVRALNVGAGRSAATATIALERDAGHAHLVVTGAAATSVETITLTTIDALVDRERLPRVDVIKVDVEGADFEVIRGALATLQRFRPAVLLEVELLARMATSIEEVERFFEDIGYATELIRHRSATDMLCRPLQ